MSENVFEISIEFPHLEEKLRNFHLNLKNQSS